MGNGDGPRATFDTWLLGIVAVLVVGAVLGGISLSRDVGVIKTKLDYIAQSIDTNANGISEADAKITALEILADRINHNHTDLKKEIEALRERLEELEAP
jgi:hypothetical protein